MAGHIKDAIKFLRLLGKEERNFIHEKHRQKDQQFRLIRVVLWRYYDRHLLYQNELFFAENCSQVKKANVIQNSSGIVKTKRGTLQFQSQLNLF